LILLQISEDFQQSLFLITPIVPIDAYSYIYKKRLVNTSNIQTTWSNH